MKYSADLIGLCLNYECLLRCFVCGVCDVRFCLKIDIAASNLYRCFKFIYMGCTRLYRKCHDTSDQADFVQEKGAFLLGTDIFYHCCNKNTFVILVLTIA